MLPGGVLGKKQLTKLKIYSGNDHPHSAQNPKLIDLDKLNTKKFDKKLTWVTYNLIQKHLN